MGRLTHLSILKKTHAAYRNAMAQFSAALGHIYFLRTFWLTSLETLLCKGPTLAHHQATAGSPVQMWTRGRSKTLSLSNCFETRRKPQLRHEPAFINLASREGTDLAQFYGFYYHFSVLADFVGANALLRH